MTRKEHLQWCKQRALAYLDGDLAGAVASMLSDINKADEPLYDALTLQTLAADAMFFCKTPEQVRHWIEGFN